MGYSFLRKIISIKIAIKFSRIMPLIVGSKMGFARAGGRVLGFGRFGGSGRSQCRVAAFKAFAGYLFSDFFITISHCAWRHVISLSKATKKRSKENAFTALP